MKLLTYICILGISILISCTGTPAGTLFPRYSSFPNEVAIEGQVISLDTALFRYPFRVAVRDSIVIIMDLHNIDHYFHAFSYPGWKHIVSFGKRGEAPEEMLSAETFQFNSLDSVWALDANRMQISRWSISPVNHTAERQEVINLDKKLVRSLDFYAMDSCFLIPDYLGEHRFSRVSYQGELIDSEGKIPSEQEYEANSMPAVAQAWRSFINYNPNNGILAMVTQLGEAVEIYNLKEKKKTIIYGPNGEPKFKIGNGIGFPTGIMGFSDVQVTDNYIYAVFHGRKFKDIIAAHQKGETPEDGGRFIYVFNLEGKPIKKYTLDHAIYAFDINEETNTMIALEVNNDDPIIQYKI